MLANIIRVVNLIICVVKMMCSSYTDLQVVIMKTCLIFYSGAGNMAYYYGYAKYLQEMFDLSDPNIEFAGVSAGGHAISFLALGISMEKVWREWFLPLTTQVYKTGASLSIFPHPTYDKVVKDLSTGLFEDHDVVSISHKLHLAVTQAFSFAHESLTKFKSSGELIDAALCTAHIPFINCNYSKDYRGTSYIDGAIGLVDDNYRPLGPPSNELNYIDVHCRGKINSIIAMGNIGDESYHEGLKSTGYDDAKQNHGVFDMFLKNKTAM